MRLPRRVICTAATAALFAATAVATPRGDAVAAGPAPGLCTMSTSRGAVPDDFSIEACVDGSSILLRNTLDVPMRFETEGDTADPVTVEINQTPAAVYTRSQEDRAGLLLPGDHMRIPIGSGEASVTLADTDAGGDYVLATTVQTFFPVGEAVNALTALVPELVDDLADHGNCLSGKNWLQQRGCDVLLARNVSFAIGRAGVRGCRECCSW